MWTPYLVGIQRKGYRKIDFKRFIEEGLKAATPCSEPHSAFFTKESYTKTIESTSGEFSGIGVSIISKDITDDWIVITDVIDGGPADKAGIKPGDKIIEVDGEKLKGLSSDEVVNKLRGPLNSKTKIKIIRNNKGKIIANEVTTGVGRTGTWFGYQHYDIEPDLLAIGKGIGNGYPVSVAVINKATVNELEMKPFKYAQSHQNDPLGAAVVREVIREIEVNELITKAGQKGQKFLTQLKSLADNEIVLDVRGRGMMFAMDLANKDVADEIYDDLIKWGYIVGNRGTSFRIDPPLILTEAEFDGFINAFKAVILSKKISHITYCFTRFGPKSGPQ